VEVGVGVDVWWSWGVEVWIRLHMGGGGRWCGEVLECGNPCSSMGNVCSNDKDPLLEVKCCGGIGLACCLYLQSGW